MQLGRINTDVFCIQYFQGQDTSYCCDHTGYFCMQSNYTIYNPNHVVQGSFMVAIRPLLLLFLTLAAGWKSDEQRG